MKNSLGKPIVGARNEINIAEETRPNRRLAVKQSEVFLPDTGTADTTQGPVSKPAFSSYIDNLFPPFKNSGFAFLTQQVDAHKAGNPDLAFGENGIALGEALLDHYYTTKALALQKDGKIVVAGYVDIGKQPEEANFALVRYNPDGNLDSTFGNGGWKFIDFDGDDDKAHALVMQGDKIIVVGEAVNLTNYSVDFALARLNSNGKLDDTFGDSGRVLTDFLDSSSDVGQAVALQPDGKIIVAGYAATFGDAVREYFALARYTHDGILDVSFGEGTGQVISNLNDSLDRVQAVCVQADGKIVAAGSTTASDGSKTDFALARYNADGSLDSTFGTYGWVTTDLGRKEDIINALAIQADQKIVVAGTSADASGMSAVLVRYNENGSLDKSFGDQGKVIAVFGGNVSAINALALRGGQIVAVGYSSRVEDGQVKLQYGALAIYNEDGSPDTTFGSNGIALPSFGGHTDSISAVAMDQEDKIVMAGTVIDENFSVFGLARY